MHGLVRRYSDSMASALSYTSPILTIPTIREDTIRHYATVQSFSRGETYYQNGVVTALTTGSAIGVGCIPDSDHRKVRSFTKADGVVETGRLVVVTV